MVVSASGVIALGLNSCGGGGGSSSDEVTVAPASLDGVTLTFESAFTLLFARVSGTSGNEVGAADYTSISTSFGISSGDGVGSTVVIPSDLEDVAYTYRRTGSNSGRITITFSNEQAYPIGETDVDSVAELSNVITDLDMFWGGPEFDARNLILDINFPNTGDTLGVNTARVRSIYWYRGTVVTNNDNGTPLIDSDDFDDRQVFTTRLEDSVGQIDRSSVILTLDGSALPVGFDPDFDTDDVSDIIYDDLNQISLIFTGAGSSGETLTVAFQTSSGGINRIDGVQGIRDSGVFLADLTGDFAGEGGIYGFQAVGGAETVLALEFTGSGFSSTAISDTLTYTLTFSTFSSGTWVGSNGRSGTFSETFFDPF